jgi:hypothetical protein
MLCVERLGDAICSGVHCQLLFYYSSRNLYVKLITIQVEETLVDLLKLLRVCRF